MYSLPLLSIQDCAKAKFTAWNGGILMGPICPSSGVSPKSSRETTGKPRRKTKALSGHCKSPPPLLRILDEHKARWKTVPGFTETYKVCGGTRSLRDTTIQLHNKKFAEMAGVKKIRIHDFRHSHASLLANAGINIQEVARRLGHSRIEMTWNTYSHLYPKEEERAIKVLDEIV